MPIASYRKDLSRYESGWELQDGEGDLQLKVRGHDGLGEIFLTPEEGEMLGMALLAAAARQGGPK